MAANTSPIFELVPFMKGATLAIGDTTAAITLITGGTNGTRIDSLMCSTNDTTAVNLAFWVDNGGADLYLGVVNVPIGSGYTTVARVEAMTTLAPTLGYLVLPNTSELKVGCVATMTTAKLTTVVALGGDY
jgi:hypothetical protein